MLKIAFPALLVALALSTTGFLQAQGPTPLLTRSAAENIAILEAADASLKDKTDACRQLTVLGGPEAVPALAALLGHETLSHMARYALEVNPGPEADRVFLEALGKLQGAPLVGVIGSLGVRRHAPAVPALIRFLDHGHPDVAQAAARALGSIGTLGAARALQAAAEYAPAENLVAICEGLGRAAEHLAAAGQVDAALGIYDHYEETWLPHQARTGALRGAILLRGADGLPLLRRMLRHDEYLLFSAAISAALDHPQPGVVVTLATELSTLPADRQIVVAQTLGQRRDPAANPALFTIAQSGDKAVRLAALRALAEIGHPTAIPVLEGLLGDPDREIRDLAKESYASLPGRQVDAAILDMLEDLDTSAQLLAIELLQRRRMTANLPTLLRVASQGGDRVRPAALRALADLGSPTLLLPLMDLLMEARTPADMEAAEETIAQLAGRAETPASHAGALVDRLARGTPPQRASLLRLLGTVGGAQALAAVRSSLKDSDADVRNTALRVLAEWRTADAAPDLLALTRNPSSATARVLTLRGYLRLATEADLPVARRLAMCREVEELLQHDDDKRLWLGTLGAVTSLDTVRMIAPHLDNAATQNEAGAALLAVADRILKGNQTGPDLAVLLEPLRKVAAGPNDNLAGRAKTLLTQAEQKAK